MKDKTFKFVTITIVLIICVAFIAKFGGPALLRAYIYIGIGNCKKIPILCKVPETEIASPKINPEYLGQLEPYVFKDIAISLPEGFTAVRGEIQKVYYKKWLKAHPEGVVYLLYERPDFFVSLFPRLKRQGINHDDEFIRRTMYASTDKIANLTDTFFIIMKSIFTPDLGDQQDVKMIQFSSGHKKGFINYNFAPRENYFDCNVMNERGDFFKIYIKDKGAKLDLEKVLAIISTVNKP